jgi:TonB family protein
MIEKNTTTYSIIGSLGIHMFFTLGAGSFLMNINKNIQLPKPYKLEFVKRKEPPPVKKEKIRKEMVRREIKVASLTPKVIPVVKPKTTVQQTTKTRALVAMPLATPRQVQRTVVTRSIVRHSSNKTRALVAMPQATPRQVQRTVVTRSVVRHSSNPTLSRRVSAPVARSIAPAKNSNVRSGTKVAIFQKTRNTNLRKLPKPVIRSGGSTSPKPEKTRLASLETHIRPVSLTSFPSPRAVPNIYDKGALKSYIGQVQRVIEGAKRYPEGARRAGRQGKLKVQFTILKNGEVNNVRLISETPYPNLNREAMAAVKRAAPFSGFPDSIMKKSLKIILPFRFELN